LLLNCATAQVAIPASVAADISRRLVNEERTFRLSMYGTPFFGDATKKFVTDVPPEMVRVLHHPDGSPAEPGAVEATFPAGTPVRVLRVEFPSAMVMNERILYTPRTLVWVYLDVGGTSKGSPPHVLVLRPGLNSENEFLAEVERYLSREDVAKQVRELPDGVRDGVLKKRAVIDMPSDALEMAWGYPELKRIELDGERRKETWRWASGKRVAVLVDGRVTELH
jgi:hypothetical protein